MQREHSVWSDVYAASRSKIQRLGPGSSSGIYLENFQAFLLGKKRLRVPVPVAGQPAAVTGF